MRKKTSWALDGVICGVAVGPASLISDTRWADETG